MKSNNSIYSSEQIVSLITASIEMRDNNTAAHSTRVSNITDEICSILDLNKKMSRQIHVAAELHDIGKIGVSDSVLKKKGRLNNLEWCEMKDHTLAGEYILQKIEGFKEISEIVKHHHERWDGHGYPSKVGGTNIPLGSRIIAVADSIDAMLSDRPYRQGMSPEECREEISRNRDKMYDCYIADIALENWDNILYARKQPFRVAV